MPGFIDLTGKRFGQLTVIDRAPDKVGPKGYHETYWNCICDCGNNYIAHGKGLRTGKTTSCGCKRKDKTRTALLGKRFGHLTVISFDHCEEDKNYQMYWLCKCDCGNEKVVDGHTLRKGQATTCGKCRGMWNGPRVTDERLYNVYRAMKERCFSSASQSYKHYGERGITICKEWTDDYQVFKKWAYENGYDENAPYGELTIERVDVNGNYCPENCKWISIQDQTWNRRNTKYYTYNGLTQNLKDWGKQYNINPEILRKRLYAGWDMEKALTEKITRSEPRAHAEKKPLKQKESKWDQIIIHDGISKTSEEWAKEYGHTKRAVNKRIRAGWPFEDAIFTPTRKTKKYTYDNECLTMDEWSVKTGIPADTIQHRMKRGYSFKEAITKPLDITRRNHLCKEQKTERNETIT